MAELPQLPESPPVDFILELIDEAGGWEHPGRLFSQSGAYCESAVRMSWAKKLLECERWLKNAARGGQEHVARVGCGIASVRSTAPGIVLIASRTLARLMILRDVGCSPAKTYFARDATASHKGWPGAVADRSLQLDASNTPLPFDHSSPTAFRVTTIVSERSVPTAADDDLLVGGG